MSMSLLNLCSSEHALPFIGSRGARTLSGAPTDGPGDTLNNIQTGAFNATDTEILHSSSFLQSSIEKMMCVSTARVWSCAALSAQCLLSVTRTVGDVLSLLDQFPLTGEGAMLTRHSVASALTVAVDASALAQQTIITLCSRARHGNVTAHRMPARRAQ
jgi:hypothetical protein